MNRKTNLPKILVITVAICLLNGYISAQQIEGWKMQPVNIQTRWAKQVSPTNVLPEYPRPQMVRRHWTNLNGLWDYAIVSYQTHPPVNYSGKILVPFPLESALSGVKKTLQPDEYLWYKRNIIKPILKNGERVLLHFGAVDYEATVFINGLEIGKHTGGYQNFSFDVTNELKKGTNELTVKVWDPSDKGPNPHGKQVLYPGNIMYTGSSGIWQTVWMETVPPVSVESLTMTPDIDNEVLRLQVNSNAKGCTIEAIATANGQTAAKLTWPADASVHLLRLNSKTLHLWSPDAPFLYDLDVRIKKNGKQVDMVKSYFGMRKIEVRKDKKSISRIFLNNKYTYNLGTLDQGFWPDGLYTAPTDAALKFDIEAIKAMGFNTIRKHIKIEPARWYYHCDRLGILVWQDMVNPSNDKQEARTEFEKEIKENLRQLHNYPSITTWVLFNEGWGAYDQARLTQWIKDTDPSRIVNGHTGENLFRGSRREPGQKWANSDMTDIHSYPSPLMPDELPGKARALGEFGGIAVSVENHLWNDVKTGFGYGDLVDPKTMKKQYAVMIDSLALFEKMGLSASIYTQPFDVEFEQNGLMTYDRAVIKMPVSEQRKINSRLWPATRNYIAMTHDFSASVADSASKDYAARLKEYNDGRRDSIFLRNLAIIADREKDISNAAKIGKAYFTALKGRMLLVNLEFIQKFTYSSKDPGFSFILNNLNQIARVTSPKYYQRRVEDIIYQEEVKQLMDEDPDWTKVDSIIKKYPVLDGEHIIGNCVVTYLYATSEGKKNGSKNLVTAATLYDDRFHKGAYNAWAWLLFQKTNDTSELIKALEWSKKEIERTSVDDGRYGGNMDTYANLLYKLGRKEEALKWSEKAMDASPDDNEIRINNKKMKKGIKTWTE